jgi:hypothetical protein
MQGVQINQVDDASRGAHLVILMASDAQNGYFELGVAEENERSW